LAGWCQLNLLIIPVSKKVEPTMEGEDRLVERAQHGEERAFEELVKHYQAPLYYLALRFVRDEQAAADLTQTAFLRAFQGLPGFRQRSSLKTWLYRITINLCKNHLRDRARKGLETSGEMDPPSPSNPLQELIKHENRRRMVQAWEQLPEKQQLTVTLKIQEEMKYHEIAEVLECTVGAVKANFHHACKKLKAILQEGRDEMS
jgi:RNA polymerase sigma-70 factor (ECF subfamily)